MSRDIGWILCVLLLVLGLAECSSYTTYATESLPQATEIKVDGKADDWLGSLSIIEDSSLSVGFRNDSENLYVCLMVEEEFLQGQIMRQGLTVWFDPRGGKTKSLGIRYPLGRPRGERPEGVQRERPEEPREEPDQPSFEDIPRGNLSRLGVVSSENGELQEMEIDEVRGIEIKAVLSRGLLVYELKMPLSQTETNLIAVGAQPGQTIGIGFETPKPDRNQMPEPPSGGMPGGGGRRPMGGAPGSGGGGQPGGRMGGGPGGPAMGEMPKGLKFWTLVHLSSGIADRPRQLL